MSHYDDDNDVIGDGTGLTLFLAIKWCLIKFFTGLPAVSITDNTTANITDYPINYADPNSPVDGVQELRTLFPLTEPFIIHIEF